MTKKKAGLQVLKLGATTKSSESINTVSSLYYVLFHTSTVLIGIHVVHAIMLSEERAESSNLPWYLVRLLVLDGMTETRMTAKGFGGDFPLP